MTHNYRISGVARSFGLPSSVPHNETPKPSFEGTAKKRLVAHLCRWRVARTCSAGCVTRP